MLYYTRPRISHNPYTQRRDELFCRQLRWGARSPPPPCPTQPCFPSHLIPNIRVHETHASQPRGKPPSKWEAGTTTARRKVAIPTESSATEFVASDSCWSCRCWWCLLDGASSDGSRDDGGLGGDYGNRCRQTTFYRHFVHFHPRSSLLTASTVYADLPNRAVREHKHDACTGQFVATQTIWHGLRSVIVDQTRGRNQVRPACIRDQ